MVYKREKFISHSLEVRKSKMKAPADSASDGNSLPVSQMAIISRSRRAERALWGFFYKGTNPIPEVGRIRQPHPHRQRPWGGSAWEAPKQNMRLGFSLRSQGLLLSREQAPWTTSTPFSGTASWLARDPASGPAAHPPQPSP